jgi:hypothetical protein
MKKILVLGAVLAFGVVQSAKAETAPAGCEFHFKVEIKSYVLWSEGGGSGKVICNDIEGNQLTARNVKIDINSLGLGLGEFRLEGVAGNLGILDPTEIKGTYAVAEAGVAFGGALHAGLGFEGQNNGLSFSGLLSVGEGIGLRLNGSTWDITLAD